MRVSKQMAILFSGAVWLGVGFMLLSKGLILLVTATTATDSLPWLEQTMHFIGDKQQSALFLISLGLLVGFIKGRMILIKTVKRVVHRIMSLPDPLLITQMYDKKYLILLCLMMAMGMSLKRLHLPSDILGTIDVAIGSALINGSLLYIRHLVAMKKAA